MRNIYTVTAQASAILVLAMLGEHFVVAFPTGAGGTCPTGTAAVGGQHVTGSETTGTLSDGMFEVTINDMVIDSAVDSTFPFVADTDYNVRVRAVSGSNATFRGALIRVEASEDAAVVSLVPTDNGQMADVCSEPVVGVTHTDNAPKTELGAALQIVGESLVTTIILDVTVVVSNNRDEGSVYYYRQYTLLNSQQETGPSTPAPTFATAPSLSPSTVNDDGGGSGIGGLLPPALRRPQPSESPSVSDAPSTVPSAPPITSSPMPPSAAPVRANMTKAPVSSPTSTGFLPAPTSRSSAMPTTNNGGSWTMIILVTVMAGINTFAFGL